MFLLSILLVVFVTTIPVSSLESNNSATLTQKIFGIGEPIANLIANFVFGQSVSVFDAERDIIFRLYTEHNWSQDQVIIFNDVKSIEKSNFNPLHPVRFIIHGWNSDSSLSGPINEMRRAYLQRGSYNLIVVDWEVGSQALYYPDVRYNTQSVALVIAYLVNLLNFEMGVPLNEIYFIGHGIGAHIAGIAGKLTRSGRINTIFALDPALPFFAYDDDSERLGPNDAKYVEVIHTGAEYSSIFTNIGSADFYVNGGLNQPNCIDITGICAHQRAVNYFVESITSNTGFWGIKCRNLTDIVNHECIISGSRMQMGGEPSNSGLADGVYYVPTNSQSPFAKGLVFP